MTMTLVSTVTVGAAGAATLEFNSIPQSGDDLLVLFSFRSSTSSVNSFIELNGVNPNFRTLQGTGSGFSSLNLTNDSLSAMSGSSSYTAATFSTGQVYIPNYKSTINKALSIETVAENNAAASGQLIAAGIAATTSAVTSIRFSAIASFVEHSTASLYTVTKGSGGATIS